MNRVYARILYGIVAAAFAVTAAGCGGAGSTPPGVSSPGALTSSIAKNFDGTTSFSTRPASVQKYADDHDKDLTLVSILQMDVSNGNASFEPYGWWDCFNLRLDTTARAADTGDNWPIYYPRSTQSFNVPSFSFDNPCQSGFGDHSKSQNANTYVVMFSLNDFSATIVAGPGSDGKTIAFQNANAPFTMQKDNVYVFFLISTSGSLPTPTPAATPTPVPCPVSTGASPPPTVRVPAPTVTSAPAGFLTFYPQSAATTAVTCNPATNRIDALSRAGYDVFNPATGSVSPVNLSRGGSNPSIIASFPSGQVLTDNGVAGGVNLILEAADGLSSIPVNVNGVATAVKAVTGSDGNVYVAGALGGTPTVFEVTSSGALTMFTAPRGCAGFNGAAADASGDVYLSDTACGIVKMTVGTGSFSTVLSSLPSGDNASALAVGPDGGLYYGSLNYAGIARVNPQTGAIQSFILPFGITNVLAIAPGSDGNLYFSADQLSGGTESGGVVGQINFTNDVVTAWPTTVSGTNDPTTIGTSPISLTAGPTGKIYGSTTTVQNNIVVIDPSKL